MTRYKAFTDAVAEWLLKDPEARQRLQESLKPLQALAWAEGYIEGRNDEIEDVDPRETTNPYEPNGET